MLKNSRQTLERLGIQARQARELGDYIQSANLERQAVELADTLHLAARRVRALLWQGYSLRQAGEDDLALATLLQAVSEQNTAADSADLFGALITLIHISLDRKPLGFCKTLLHQARCYLADLKQPWDASLGYLEGELAYRQGDFTTAWRQHQQAWAGWRDQHPRLTSGSHLWALCRTAFRRCDLAALEHLNTQWLAFESATILEQQLKQRAELLMWRSRRAVETPSSDAEVMNIAEKAQALLAAVLRNGHRDFGARCDTLRILALTGHWNTIDEVRSHHQSKPDSLYDALLWGDLALTQVRIGLGLPVVDDDYDSSTGMLSVSSPADTRIQDHLTSAVAHYHAALSLAEAEDERLQTQWHQTVVKQRLRIGSYLLK